MLRDLRIKNFAIIEDISLSFDDGFVVITGETGSGKSIIINALDLLLGGKSSRKVVRKGNGEAVIEGCFFPNQGLLENEALSEFAFKNGETFVLRRKIFSNGRSSAALNGKAVSVQVLEIIASDLVDIHGQHQHQDLLRTETHIDYLDVFGNLKDSVEKISKIYKEYRKLNDFILNIEKEKIKALGNRELWEFQRLEINELDIKEGEDISIRNEIKVLNNAAYLAESVKKAEGVMDDDDDSIISKSRKLLSLLEQIETVNPDISALRKRFDSLCIDMEDISIDLKGFSEIGEDPERLELLNARLFAIEELKRKYGGSIKLILDKEKELSSKLEEIEDSSFKKKELVEKLNVIKNRLEAGCKKLTEKREKTAESLEKSIVSELGMVGMKQTCFEIEFEPISGDGFGPKGAQKCSFWFSANQGISLEPLHMVASGGELSRIMLCIKSVCLEDSQVKGKNKKTLVFDEVDTGIGGQTASVVGKKLKDLSEKHQLICITHLPQIAVYGDRHLMVEKYFSGGNTFFKAKKLSPDEREIELGRMLGGETTNTALEHVREMLKMSKCPTSPA